MIMANNTGGGLHIHLHADIDGFEMLAELALDMRCSWEQIKDNLWRQLDPALWEISRNPWIVLQSLSRARIERALADPLFRQNLMEMMQAPEPHLHKPGQCPLRGVNFFKL
jgi:glycogen phosphorylase